MKAAEAQKQPKSQPHPKESALRNHPAYTCQPAPRGQQCLLPPRTPRENGYIPHGFQNKDNGQRTQVEDTTPLETEHNRELSPGPSTDRDVKTKEPMSEGLHKKRRRGRDSESQITEGSPTKKQNTTGADVTDMPALFECTAEEFQRYMAKLQHHTRQEPDNHGVHERSPPWATSK
ncbi:hypothetical protein B0T16DRAFT_460812 [Cercophora newfieldiana]|uniref:Uncharacterized protein n=1 Tax=Cercophora newfieldiana TaxID=92897 RepID=A0AA39XW18_9PEZI|nr:hypothetical protein B0T16DRAFT_460812 [Cercophora newfieldiana]